MKDLRKEFESIIQEAIWQVITFDEAVEESLHVVDQQHQELREKIRKLDPSTHYSEWGDDYSNGFDDAITDVLKLLDKTPTRS